MEIKVERKQSLVAFGTLDCGDTFLSQNCDKVFLVLKPDYNLGDNWEEYDGFAVALDTGEIYGFLDTERVVLVKTSLVATEA